MKALRHGIQILIRTPDRGGQHVTERHLQNVYVTPRIATQRAHNMRGSRRLHHTFWSGSGSRGSSCRSRGTHMILQTFNKRLCEHRYEPQLAHECAQIRRCLQTPAASLGVRAVGCPTLRSFGTWGSDGISGMAPALLYHLSHGCPNHLYHRAAQEHDLVTAPPLTAQIAWATPAPLHHQ